MAARFLTDLSGRLPIHRRHRGAIFLMDARVKPADDGGTN